MTKASLISPRNLDLAWSRITTARNLQHKRMFRHLYSAYEPGRKANLALLHERLKGDWKPTDPIRIYMPKASGLLRPLTLLALDDQIVLQAIANQIARQMFDRRRAVEGRSVFSNCLAPDRDSIFFLQDWRATYHQFKTRLQRHLDAGNQWIAHFDLAAFYETISHRALQSIVSPAGGGGEAWRLIREWLCVWTSSHGGIPVDHGIPQGPIASDFLAEVFLLPLDDAMKKTGIPYIRYVDDIRVLAKTEAEARRAAITLELECRSLSLIPQSSKFSVSHAETLTEALGALPSIAESTGREGDEGELNEASAISILCDAIAGRPARVVVQIVASPIRSRDLRMTAFTELLLSPPLRRYPQPAGKHSSSHLSHHLQARSGTWYLRFRRAACFPHLPSGFPRARRKAAFAASPPMLSQPRLLP